MAQVGAAFGPVLSVSLLALLLLLHLLACATTPVLLSFAAIRGRKYDWYLYTMSLVSLSSVAVIVVMPIVLALGDAVPCAVGYLFRYVLPPFTSGLYLLGHLSVLTVFARSDKPPEVPQRRGPSVEAIPKTNQPSMRRACVCFLLYMAPLAATPSSIFALPIAACQDDDTFRSLYWIQVSQGCVWAVGCKYISLLYSRTHGKSMERFRTIHIKTSKGIFASALVIAGIILVALALHWDGVYALYLDYTAMDVLHCNLAFWYFDGYRKSKRVAGVGPHLRTISARTMSFRSNKSTAEDTDAVPLRQEMDEIRRFLSLDDYFSDFLAFCETLGRTHEPLAWRLVQLHKQRKVLPAVVYNDCMSPNGPLVTMTGLSMAPKVASVVRGRPDAVVGETLDQLYAAFETDLLRAICQHVLPKYQKSGRLWYSFVQRPADIAPPEPLLLTNTPSMTTISHAPSTLLPTTNEHGSNTTDGAVPGSHDAAGSHPSVT
ncbi:hypothetical protein SDRG_14065 [Saprolegnia diclina VS20]|uniref:RGS domain-containing protein n=1 Tax=Saprolegnia diclina (strain VS20) TaxID=1156394 RepID=T0RF10_SAPDV|nr:hypothetical protein SDRG_14065 [Saprolegnia diclina VS20]EQC28242.1 hypothetical protein SDRG_14065 [Saprolegnia diclina VS20]|eukprot:XP_008618391.1 hypothetical protein SDRG_14065 [Saprolegnia diclina VS20]